MGFHQQKYKKKKKVLVCWVVQLQKRELRILLQDITIFPKMLNYAFLCVELPKGFTTQGPLHINDSHSDSSSVFFCCGHHCPTEGRISRDLPVMHWTVLFPLPFSSGSGCLSLADLVDFCVCPQHCYPRNFINPALWDRPQMLRWRTAHFTGLTDTKEAEFVLFFQRFKPWIISSEGDLMWHCSSRKWKRTMKWRNWEMRHHQHSHLSFGGALFFFF